MEIGEHLKKRVDAVYQRRINLPPGKWKQKRSICSGSIETSRLRFIHGCQPRALKDFCCLQCIFGVGGIIRCTIMGPRQYSTDLRQGGLDMPCKLTFTGVNPHLSNVARLVKRFEIPKKRKNYQ